MCSHPNPQAEYGQDEIGTNLEQSGEEMIERLKKVGDALQENPLLKPSQRIEEIRKEILDEFLKDSDGDIRLVSVLIQANYLNHLAILRYLDEQHAKSGIIS